MNGRKAKALRKIIYGTRDFRKREYGQHKTTKSIMNLADIEEIDNGVTVKRIPVRRIYSHLKGLLKNVRISQIPNIIFEEVKGKQKAK